MYDGTLYGQWEALVTFQQFIVLCDADGIIDMTPPAIAARTSIPLEIIKKGIEILESPDPYSRTQGQDGRRIELIDAHRPWGWHIVNHGKYQHMQDADTIRSQTRERVRRHRESRRLAEGDATGNASCNAAVTDANASKRHTNTDTDTDTKRKTIAPLALLAALGVPEKLSLDFIKLRKEKRIAITETAMQGVKREAGKAGVSLEDALRICCENGWAGFKAAWLKKENEARKEVVYT